MKRCDADVKIYSPSGLLNVKPSKEIEMVEVSSREYPIPVHYPRETVSGEYVVSMWSKTFVYTIDKPENGKWKLEVLSACNSMTIKIEKE